MYFMKDYKHQNQARSRQRQTHEFLIVKPCPKRCWVDSKRKEAEKSTSIHILPRSDWTELHAGTASGSDKLLEFISLREESSWLMPHSFETLKYLSVQLRRTLLVLKIMYPHNPSPKVTMRIQIKLTKCEEIGIFCRNIAEKFILKFAKLFYIKKTRGFMPFSSTICDFYNKKLKF